MFTLPELMNFATMIELYITCMVITLCDKKASDKSERYIMRHRDKPETVTKPTPWTGRGGGGNHR